MKSIWIFLLFILLSQSSFSSHKQSLDIDSNSAINGVYECILNTGKSRGPYGLGGNKSLVRVHLWKYGFPNRRFRDKFNTLTKKMIKPNPLLGCIQVYPNKRGRGEPLVYYFSSVSYESGEDLLVEDVQWVATNKRAPLRLVTGRLKNFEIKKLSRNSWQMELPYSLGGTFERVKPYEEIPNLFYTYCDLVLDRFADNYAKKLFLGRTGRSPKGKLIVHDISAQAETAEACFVSSDRSGFDLENPSARWFKYLKFNINNSLMDEQHGIHSVLAFLPNLKTIKVSFSDPSVFSEPFKEANHVYDVNLEPVRLAINTTIVPTNLGLEITKKGEVADSKREEMAIARAKEEELKRKNQAEKLRQEAIQAKKAIFAMLAKTTSTGEPTAEQMEFAIANNVAVKSNLLKSPASMDLDKDSNAVEVIANVMGKGFSNFDISISQFKKYTCEKKVNAGAFNCSYLVKFEMGMRSG